MTSATANSEGYTFQISDFGGSVVDPATGIDSIFIDSAPITPTSVTKTGSVITVTYTSPTPLPSRSSYTYEINIRDQTSAIYSYLGSVTTPILPAGNLLTAEASTEFWNVTEVATGGLLSPFDIGRAADVFLEGAAFSSFISTANYINFTDPQTNNQSGMFRYDQPFLSNTDAADDFLVQGSNFRMTVTGTTPEELQRSFWVRSDDGFALRIKGASFINKAGAGLIDPAASDTLTFLVGTGDSNTRGLCQFPVAGEYVVEFLYFEGDGGSYNELAVANGDFINNTDGTPWSLLGSPSLTPLLPATLPATPVGAPAGQWNVREIRTADPAVYGNSLAGAIAFASGDLTGGTVTDGTSPVINFNDLDGATALTALGFFNNDVPFLSNTPGDDNALIGVYRATINFTAGLHTIGAYADDGWAITVPGAWFVSNTGTGAFDPETSATMYDTNFNDGPTLGVLNIPTAGNYDVFFIAQEGIGGGGWEVFSAPGAFGTIGGTADWALIGNSAGIAAPTPIFPDALPGPEGSDGLWGVRFIRNANASGSIFTALTAVNAGSGTITDGTAPYLNFSDTDGGLGLFKIDAAVAAYQVAEEPYFASPGSDDNIIAVAKATIVIPPGEGGEWTFGVHSDDGFALKIDGAVFKRVSGGSFIQPGVKDTAYFRFGTGDADARIVMDIPEGTHDVEFLWFEGAFGSYFELYAAKGAFANDGDTDTWRLVGGAEGLTLVGAAPSDPGFQISSIVPGPGAGEYTVTFPSVTGTSYSAEWNSVLNTPFAPISTITGAAGTETSFVVNPATLNGGPISRFFVRVRRN